MSGPPVKRHSPEAVHTGHCGAGARSVLSKQPGTLSFALDPYTSFVVASSGSAEEVLGLSEHACASHGAILRAHIHEDDRYQAEHLLEESLAHRTPLVSTYRWIRPDTGQTIVLHARAQFQPERGAFEGFIVDVTDTIPLLAGRGSLDITIEHTLNYLELRGTTLDMSLSLRTVVAPQGLGFLALGRSDFSEGAAKPAMSFLHCFTTSESRAWIQSLFDEALSSATHTTCVEWPGNRAHIRVLAPTGIPEGYLIYVRDVSDEQRLRDENAALRRRIDQLESAGRAVPELLNLSQEIVGYSAVIQRQAGESPLSRHMASALASSVREFSARSRELLEPLQGPSPQHAPEPRPLVRSRKSSLAPVAVYAAVAASVHHVQAALLSDGGIPTVGISLDSDEIQSLLRDKRSVRTVVIDVPGKAYPVSTTMRMLRRFFPTVHIVCLVPGTPSQFPEVQRAGAILVLPKPTTTKELERVVRGLLHLSVAMDPAPAHDVADANGE